MEPPRVVNSPPIENALATPSNDLKSAETGADETSEARDLEPATSRDSDSRPKWRRPILLRLALHLVIWLVMTG